MNLLDSQHPFSDILNAVKDLAHTLIDVEEADDTLDRIELIVEADERIAELSEALDEAQHLHGAKEFSFALREATDLLDDGRHRELAEGLVATCARVFAHGLADEQEHMDYLSDAADAQSW